MFDPGQLRAELASLPPGAWSLPSTFAGTGVHHGYRRVVVVTARHPELVAFADVLDAFAPVYDAWLSWIEPGGFIVRHRDRGPYHERWQVPIIAGPFEGLEPRDGVSFPVRHWEPHSVAICEADRIHLVIDRDVWANETPAPFWKEGHGPQGIPSP